jgi:hypothetical protein
LFKFTTKIANSLLLIGCYLLTACSTLPAPNSAITPIRTKAEISAIIAEHTAPFITHPTPNHFSICLEHSCTKFAFLSLSSSQWQQIEALFSPRPTTAKQERTQLQQAIALLEQFSGTLAGTYLDKAENNIANGINGQLDCIDEATNTTVYLRLIYDANLLTFHQQGSRTSRGGLIRPHNTATIFDTESDTRYAVDSWFFDNGQAPVIVPLAVWKSGWKPKKNE